MSKLRGADRRYLRSQAHHLQPVVQIGKQGLTERVLATIDENLSAHELIKIRFGDFKDQKKALSAEIAEELRAEVAGVIGHVAILYRPHAESDKRKIRLPKRVAVEEVETEG
jgi:RNA-binding protein